MLRKASAAPLILMLILSASAVSFGSFSGTDSKKVSSSTAEFGVSVFNMGDSPVKVDVNSENVEGADIVHPDSMTIAPSEITRNPGSDSEWFLLEDGRYVSVQTVPVEVTKQSDRDRYSFDVSLSASEDIENDGDSGAVQNIVQTRSYSFEAVFEESSGQGGATTPSSSSPQSEDSQSPTQTGSSQTGSLTSNLPNIGNLGRSVQKVFQDSKQQEDTEDNPKSTDTNTGSSQKPDTSGPEKKTNQRNSSESGKNGGSITGNFLAGANQVTIVLFALMAGTMIYMVKVI